MTTFIEDNRKDEDNNEEDDFKTKLHRVHPIKGFFLNRRNQLTIFVWIFALTVPIVIYYFLFHSLLPIEVTSTTCSINATFRIPCGRLATLESKITRAECLEVKCCFDDTNFECFHTLPSAYYYHINDNTPSVPKVPFASAKMDPKMFFQFDDVTDDSISIVLSDQSGGDFDSDVNSNFELYENKNSNRMELNIKRKLNDDLLLTTSLGPLISSENYLEITIYLGPILFGLDELYFKGNETITKIIYYNENNHWTQPVFMGFQNGFFHAFSIDSYGGPMELTILPSKLIIIKVIGERKLKMRFHSGPNPNIITQFFYNLNGFNSIPERWVLDAHICRSGSHDLKEAIEIPRNYGNYESDCFHENLYFLMLLNDDEELKNEFMEELKQLKESAKFILTIFPHVPIESEIYQQISDEDKKSIFYLNATTNEPHIGKYMDWDVAYPDYTNPNIGEILIEKIKEFFQEFQPDAFSFSNNWASDNSTTEIDDLSDFIYTPENITESLLETIPWNSITQKSNLEHIYNHNNYGKSHVESYGEINKLFSSISTSNVIPQIENQNGTWANLKLSLKRTLITSLFKNPLISIPICGSTQFLNDETYQALCSRWYIMAATMPIFTINSEPPFRDIANMGSLTHENIALKALERRREFALYYYGFLMENQPIVRPMFYEFFDDLNTFELDEQYMVGDGLLVAQPFLQNVVTITIYIPKNEIFYEYFGGQKYEMDDKPDSIRLTVVPSDWFLFIRGGKIVPTFVEDAYYDVRIALSANGEASGILNIDGKVLNFDADSSEVKISNINEFKTVLNCGEFVKEFPTTIRWLFVYGLSDEKKIKYLTNTDLCTVEDDTYTITYPIEENCKGKLIK